VKRKSIGSIAWSCLTVLLTLSGLARLAAQAIPSPGRLAIISEAADTAGVADVLTVQLSRQPQLIVLEREQIEKVYREQNLAGANRDFLKLGQLLGADGLLVLTPVRKGTNHFLLTRLVATKPGVVIAEVGAPWPIEKVAEWADGLVAHIKPLFPKLTVLPKDAVPVSVLNLRSALRTTAAQSVENELTMLLIHRLTRQREVFVLERQHLGEIQFEKELLLDESPFWTGRYLLDGVLDQEGFHAEHTKLNARLSSAGGGAVIALEVSGSRTNLPEMAEALVGQVLTALHRETSTSEWRPLAEAEQYCQEARWALRWGLQSEARAASESAWALGLQTKEVALLRIRSYASGIPISFWSTSTELDRLPPMPDEAKLKPAIRALALLAEGLPRFATTNLDEEAEWLKTGYDTINQASGLLENYHRLVETRAGVTESLTQLRLQARQAARQMPTNLTRRLASYSTDRSSIRRWQQLVSEWQQLRWNWGGLWCETPEAGALLFHQVLKDGWHPSASLASQVLPRFVAWSWGDRQRIPAVAEQFLQELQNSSEASLRLEGFYLAVLQDSPEPVGHLESTLRAWTEELWRQRDRLFEGQMNETVLMSVRAALQKKHGEDRMASEAWETFADYLIRLRTDYLMKAPVFTYEGFRSVFPYRSEDVFTEDAARQLLPLFSQFGERFDQPTRQAARYLSEKSNALAAVLGKAPLGPGRVGAVIPAAGSDEAQWLGDPVVTTMTPLDLPWESDAFSPLGTPVYRNGKLWLLAFHHNEYFTRGVRVGGGAYFISVDLRTGRQEKISPPEAVGSPYRTFAITEDSLYATAVNRILRFRLNEKRWELIEAPLPEGARIQEIGGRFFLTTADSVLGFDPTNRTIQVLASARRRPAVNELDTMDATRGYGFPELFPVADAEVGVAVQNRFFVYATTAAKWRERDLPFSAKSVSLNSVPAGSKRAFLEQQVSLVDAPERLWEFQPERGFNLLFQRLDPNHPLASRRQATTESLPWKWPPQFSLMDSFIAADGDSWWGLAQRSRWQGGFDFSRLRLLRFEPGRSEPLAVELQFMAAGKPADLSNMVPFRESRHLSFLVVPEGLVVVAERQLGYWFIPHGAIKSKFEAQRSKSRTKAEGESTRATAAAGGSQLNSTR
jgi:curli biogenesis system outer membrane secretion channel CsgG